MKCVDAPQCARLVRFQKWMCIMLQVRAVFVPNGSEHDLRFSFAFSFFSFTTAAPALTCVSDDNGHDLKFSFASKCFLHAYRCTSEYGSGWGSVLHLCVFFSDDNEHDLRFSFASRCTTMCVFPKYDAVMGVLTSPKGIAKWIAWCPAFVASVVQLPWCSFLGAASLLQLCWCSFLGATSLAQLLCCSFAGATFLVQLS